MVNKHSKSHQVSTELVCTVNITFKYGTVVQIIIKLVQGLIQYVLTLLRTETFFTIVITSWSTLCKFCFLFCFGSDIEMGDFPESLGRLAFSSNLRDSLDATLLGSPVGVSTILVDGTSSAVEPPVVQKMQRLK